MRIKLEDPEMVHQAKTGAEANEATENKAEQSK
jgi:hypothetical protein